MPGGKAGAKMPRWKECRAEKRTKQEQAVALAVFTWIGLSLDLNNPGRSQIVLNLIASFHSFNLARLLLLPGLYFLFKKALEIRFDEKRWTRLVPACFFAANMVLGFSFAQTGNWTPLLSLRDGQLIKTIVVWLAWSAVLYYLLTMLFTLLDTCHVSETEGVDPEKEASRNGFHPLLWFGKQIRKHPFLTPFLTLLILYLPHFLISYPALFMGDTWSMIVQGYSGLGMTGVDYLSPENVLRAGVYINQHHPAFYTLLLHMSLRLGNRLFGSLNAGIFILCLGQSVVIIASFAYGISALSKCRAAQKILLLLMLYAYIHPQIRNFLFLVTKDGLYTACFMMLTTSFFLIRTGRGTRKDVILLCLAAMGVILLRNEGKYVLLASGLLMAWADRKTRKSILYFSAAAILFSLGVYQGVYPLLGFTKGGRQEALSIPFQQIARVVREHPDDISDPEKAAINAVLDYDLIAAKYNPDSADQVKELFRQEATGQELAACLRVWARLAVRHPDTCLQATYGNYYEYLYPGNVRMSYYDYRWSAWMCDFTNDKIKALGESFSLPEWNERFRFISDSMVDAGLFHLPPLSLIMTPALYSWMLISMMCWIAGKKKDSIHSGRLTMMIPLSVSFLVMFAGPTNGFYSRYMLTLTSLLPFLTVMVLMLHEKENPFPGTESDLLHETSTGEET